MRCKGKSKLLLCGAILLPGALRLAGELLPQNFISGWLTAFVVVSIVTAAAAASIYLAVLAVNAGNRG
ncbi:MAG: hypothetical protein JXA62_05650 [Candidatus Aminicenantes bacterium]|nr:hypothetical protein [Candidatus Aminicenantes bacterium]